MGVVGVFIGANASKKNVRHGRAFSTAAAQLGGFRATSGRRSECHLHWLGGVYGLWAPPFVRWVIYFPLGPLEWRGSAWYESGELAAVDLIPLLANC